MSAAIRELLPFYANGTLSDDERRAVETAIEADPALAAEARNVANLHTVAQRMPAPRSPGEFGLARLHRTLDREATTASAPVRKSGFRLEAVAAIAALTALFVATATVLYQDRALDYYQASGVAAGYDAARVLTVSFDPAAPQSAVTALLSEAGLTVVDGPSALGLYRLAPLDADAPLDAFAARLEASGSVATVTLP